MVCQYCFVYGWFGYEYGFIWQVMCQECSDVVWVVGFFVVGEQECGIVIVGIGCCYQCSGGVFDVIYVQVDYVVVQVVYYMWIGILVW